MEAETRRRLVSLIKLTLLVLAVGVVGFLALGGIRGRLGGASTTPGPRCNADHRFAQLDLSPALKADLAFDSCTGEICRTWNWSAAVVNDPAHAPFKDTPLCAALAARPAK